MAGVLLGFTLLKGLVTVPHDWAVSHYLLNYSEGIVKRGLAGTVLLPLFAGKDGGTIRGIIVGVSFAVLTGFALVVARATGALARSGSSSAWSRDDLCVALLFASSSFVWHTAMCLGYFDGLVVSLGLYAVQGGRLALRRFVPVVAVALLVHEMSAVLLVPVLLLAPLAADRPPWGVDRRRAAWVLAAIGAMAVLAGILFAARPTEALHAAMLARRASPARWVDIVHRLLGSSARDSIEHVLATADLGLIYGRGLLVFLPTTILTVGFGMARLWRLGLPGRARWAWAGVYLVASTSSLILVLIAFDFARLFSLTQAQAFLAYLVIRHKSELTVTAPAGTGPGRASWRSHVALGLAAALVVGNLLMPARFTFMRPLPRFQPSGIEAWLVDPLGELAKRILQ